VIFLLRQLCESLEEAHAAGLVHRDIKPANVVLCRHGLRHDFVKVLDFGLVALGPETVDPKLTGEGNFAGTPAYLAPEMATGSANIDGRADIYAIGCVAHWLLTARPPFERETPMATVLAHLNDAPDAPSLGSELPIPAALDALVLQCLEKRPQDRPTSVAELSQRLNEVHDTEGWSQEQARRWWQTHDPSRRQPSGAPAPEEGLKVTRALFPR